MKSLRAVIGFVRQLQSPLSSYILIAVSCVGGEYVLCMRNCKAPAAHNAVGRGPSHVVDDMFGAVVSA